MNAAGTMPDRSSLDKPLLPPVVAGEPLTDSARAHGLWEPLAAIPAGARLKRRDGEPLTDSEYVLWEGSTWERCCWPCCCCAPCCCVASHWTLTSRRFDKRHGCCGMSEDTLDLRRIADVHFDAGAFPCACCAPPCLRPPPEAELMRGPCCWQAACARA